MIRNSTSKVASYLPHALAAAALFGLAGCYVEAEGPRPHCAEAVWVRGHHDRYGDWHPGHYRCRGSRVIVVGSR